MKRKTNRTKSMRPPADRILEGINDAYARAIDLIRSADRLCMAMSGLGKPQTAIRFWAQLDCLRFPGWQSPVLEPSEIPLVESIHMAARSNVSFEWHNQRFRCVHRAVEELTNAISFAVLFSISRRPNTIIPIGPPEDTDSDSDTWERHYLDRAQAHGLLKSIGQPTNAWSAFQRRFLREIACVHWTGPNVEILRTELALEMNAACQYVQRGKELPPPEPESPYAEPLNFAKDHFPKTLRNIIEIVSESDGQILLSDLAKRIGWAAKSRDGCYQGAKTRINKAFKKYRLAWHIDRVRNVVRLSKTS